MDVVHAVGGYFAIRVARTSHSKWTGAENVKKGSGDKPDVDVVIAESGELPVTETPEKTEGEKVPPKEDL